MTKRSIWGQLTHYWQCEFRPGDFVSPDGRDDIIEKVIKVQPGSIFPMRGAEITVRRVLPEVWPDPMIRLARFYHRRSLMDVARMKVARRQ